MPVPPKSRQSVWIYFEIIISQMTIATQWKHWQCIVCTATICNSIYLITKTIWTFSDGHCLTDRAVWFKTSRCLCCFSSLPWVSGTALLFSNEYAFSSSPTLDVWSTFVPLVGHAVMLPVLQCESHCCVKKIVPLSWWNWVLHFHQILNKLEAYDWCSSGLCVCVAPFNALSSSDPGRTWIW